MARVLIPFTTGVEEIELTAIVDILRRADVNVVMAGLETLEVTGRSAIKIRADRLLADVVDAPWDMVVLPGGLPNAELLRADPRIGVLIGRMRKENKPLAAICAAPWVFAAYGVAAGRRMTSHPGFEARIKESEPSVTYTQAAVEDDGFLTTSRGAGTAVEFALHLVTKLCGEEKSMEIRAAIVA